MRNALHLSETSTTATKSNKTAELASLGRQLAVPMKCSAPVSPSSVRPLPEPFSEDSDDLPWNVSRAAQALGVSVRTIDNCIAQQKIRVPRIGRRVLVPMNSIEAALKRGALETHSGNRNSDPRHDPSGVQKT